MIQGDYQTELRIFISYFNFELFTCEKSWWQCTHRSCNNLASGPFGSFLCFLIFLSFSFCFLWRGGEGNLSLLEGASLDTPHFCPTLDNSPMTSVSSQVINNLNDISLITSDHYSQWYQSHHKWSLVSMISVSLQVITILNDISLITSDH